MRVMQTCFWVGLATAYVQSHSCWELQGCYLLFAVITLLIAAFGVGSLVLGRHMVFCRDWVLLKCSMTIDR